MAAKPIRSWPESGVGGRLKRLACIRYRRWFANSTDKEVLEIALIENVQRADLNPVEEAHGYQQLIDQFDYTQQQLAESIGKSRSHIANTLRLTALPASVLEALQTGKLTAGHARALIATETRNRSPRKSSPWDCLSARPRRWRATPVRDRQASRLKSRGIPI